MGWIYSQSKGTLINPAGNVVGYGYSGNGKGLNNPAMESVHDVGPIPAGDWKIGAFFDDIGFKGPMVAHLAPLEGARVFGRSGFMIHGDNARVDHSASEGCIILPHVVRGMIMASNDRLLTVTA